MFNNSEIKEPQRPSKNDARYLTFKQPFVRHSIVDASMVEFDVPSHYHGFFIDSDFGYIEYIAHDAVHAHATPQLLTAQCENMGIIPPEGGYLFIKPESKVQHRIALLRVDSPKTKNDALSIYPVIILPC